MYRYNMHKKLHYENFNGFLDLYGNLEWEEYKFLFREFLDGFKTLSKDEKIKFLENIDFYKVNDLKIRAYTNSAIRQIIANDKEFNIEDIKLFKNYFTDEFILKDPWYPEIARGYLKIYCTHRTSPEFTANNVMFGENPAFVV